MINVPQLTMADDRHDDQQDRGSNRSSKHSTPRSGVSSVGSYGAPNSNHTPKYNNAPTFGSHLRKNASSLKPRAHPFFTGRYCPENDIRGFNKAGDTLSACSAHPPPGPKISSAWLDAGLGWATTHFEDVERYDPELQHAGKFRCRHKNLDGERCDHVVEGHEWCKDTTCWCPCGGAPEQMADHLYKDHRSLVPPHREWATGICHCAEGGCCESCCCTPCQYSRQMMATHGQADVFNLLLCVRGALPFCCHAPFGGYFPCSMGPCGMAWATRHRTVVLNRIDEGCCATCCIAHWFPLCSLMQTHRDLIAAQVSPGGICGSSVRYSLGPQAS